MAKIVSIEFTALKVRTYGNDNVKTIYIKAYICFAVFGENNWYILQIAVHVNFHSLIVKLQTGMKYCRQRKVSIDTNKTLEPYNSDVKRGSYGDIASNFINTKCHAVH